MTDEFDGFVDEFKERRDRAISLINRQDIQGALFQFLRLSSEGDIDSDLFISQIYEFGWGKVEQDYDLAIRYNHRVLNTIDLPSVRLDLARCYLFRGRESGDPDDYAQALRYFRTLEGSDEWSIYFALGLMYERGEGVERDIDQAMEYYQIAADNDHAFAAFRRAFLIRRRNLKRLKLHAGVRPLARAMSRFKRLRKEAPNDWRLGIFPFDPDADRKIEEAREKAEKLMSPIAKMEADQEPKTVLMGCLHMLIASLTIMAGPILFLIYHFRHEIFGYY